MTVGLKKISFFILKIGRHQETNLGILVFWGEHEPCGPSNGRLLSLKQQWVVTLPPPLWDAWVGTWGPSFSAAGVEGRVRSRCRNPWGSFLLSRDLDGEEYYRATGIRSQAVSAGLTQNVIWSYRLVPTHIFGVALLMPRSSRSPWVWMTRWNMSVISHTSCPVPCYPVWGDPVSSAHTFSQSSHPQKAIPPTLNCTNTFSSLSFKAGHPDLFRSGLQDQQFLCVGCSIDFWRGFGKQEQVKIVMGMLNMTQTWAKSMWSHSYFPS